MKKTRNIKNLDTLEKEIYRLKLEAKQIEEKLDQNLDYLQENFSSMTMNSFFHKKKHTENGKTGFFDSAFKNDTFNTAIGKITDRIAVKAADGFESLVDKIFEKKK